MLLGNGNSWGVEAKPAGTTRPVGSNLCLLNTNLSEDSVFARTIEDIINLLLSIHIKEKPKRFFAKEQTITLTLKDLAILQRSNLFQIVKPLSKQFLEIIENLDVKKLLTEEEVIICSNIENENEKMGMLFLIRMIDAVKKTILEPQVKEKFDKITTELFKKENIGNIKKIAFQIGPKL